MIRCFGCDGHEQGLRDGIAWSKSSVRAILANPRYTGRQVWNRQHKRESLLGDWLATVFLPHRLDDTIAGAAALLRLRKTQSAG
ncbi:recombinase family protein [Streptomyces sp. SAJ15]|uniref:recombinase family protein n=1 Tax=Streptomyces sp. SAJ15 TaxID=2011095 RepID=UPI0021B48759|nr:recombinase family protein [Streptomyces sp. SAJ15]